VTQPSSGAPAGDAGGRATLGAGPARVPPGRKPVPTEPEHRPPKRLRRDRALRRTGVAILTLLLLIGALGFLGPRTDVATATAGGYTLSVTYPSITRPGLPVRWELTVTHAGGFDGPVRIATTFDALHLFDISNIEPDAQQATGSLGDVIYAFDPPAGDTFRATLDGNTEPNAHEVPDVTTSVLVDGNAAVSVRYRVVVVP
jgi:hypothetical protein